MPKRQCPVCGRELEPGEACYHSGARHLIKHDAPVGAHDFEPDTEEGAYDDIDITEPGDSNEPD